MVSSRVERIKLLRAYIRPSSRRAGGQLQITSYELRCESERFASFRRLDPKVGSESYGVPHRRPRWLGIENGTCGFRKTYAYAASQGKVLHDFSPEYPPFAPQLGSSRARFPSGVPFRMEKKTTISNCSGALRASKRMPLKPCLSVLQ